jgi:pectate lyase
MDPRVLRNTCVLALALSCAIAPAGCGSTRAGAQPDAASGAGGGGGTGGARSGGTGGAAGGGIDVSPGTIPAFPGAEGFGRMSRGGRGADVCHVTTLADAGPGSLRSCLSGAGRTVVFEVGGWITLATNLLVYSNVTIAGQTAPGGGIGIRGRTVIVSGFNVVMRYLRIRHGTLVNTSREDSLIITSGVENVIVDHCSVGFGIDENMSLPGDEPTGPRNVTVQWTINGYALQQTNHSAGSLLTANGTTIHHTLWALNKTRNPRARTAPGAVLDWVNNVVYGWDAPHPYGEAQGWSLSADPFMLANTGTGKHAANAVGNVFVSLRPAEQGFVAAMAGADGTPAFDLHFADNLLDGNANGVFDMSKSDWSMVAQPTAALPERLPAPEVTTDPAAAAFERVLAGAGATLPARDEVDARLVAHARAQTGGLITTEADLAAEGVGAEGYGALAPGEPPADTDRDGMPDEWEIARGLDPADRADRNADPDGDGYTALEDYLNGLVPPGP